MPWPVADQQGARRGEAPDREARGQRERGRGAAGRCGGQRGRSWGRSSPPSASASTSASTSLASAASGPQSVAKGADAGHGGGPGVRVELPAAQAEGEVERRRRVRRRCLGGRRRRRRWRRQQSFSHLLELRGRCSGFFAHSLVFVACSLLSKDGKLQGAKAKRENAARKEFGRRGNCLDFFLAVKVKERGSKLEIKIDEKTAVSFRKKATPFRSQRPLFSSFFFLNKSHRPCCRLPFGALADLSCGEARIAAPFFVATVDALMASSSAALIALSLQRRPPPRPRRPSTRWPASPRPQAR